MTQQPEVELASSYVGDFFVFWSAHLWVVGDKPIASAQFLLYPNLSARGV